MVRKIFLLILALAAVSVAFFSYTKYIARRDVSELLNDTRLSTSVRTALALNRHLNNTEIEVSASDGVITLRGAVGTEIQRQLAEDIALSIKGANKLVNNLKVNRVLTQKPALRERTLGEKLDDLTIKAAVKTAFLLNENLKAREIGVDSERGIVTLTGVVDSPAEAELARKIADDVDGVVSVENALEIKDAGGSGDTRTAREKVDDSRIVVQVRAALMVNRNIDSTEIEISSSSGIVTLTGIVQSGAEKELVQRITEGCWGVKGVINELRIIRREIGDVR